MLEPKEKKVSVIIPVYNLEDYVESCLNSLVNQTLKEIELIVVNDGSTDESQKVIDKFAKQYPDKIKAYQIPNGGVANARQFGIEKATGEYIGFVDSDDYVDKTMYEKLYQKAVEENADIVTCAYYREYETRCVEKEGKFNAIYGYSVYEKPELYVDSVPYIWNKIFKRDLIAKSKICFPNLKVYEDLVFTYKLYLNANKISKVFEPLYYYIVTRDTSLSNQFSERRFDIFAAFKEVVFYMKEKKCFEKFENEILFLLLKHIYIVLAKDTTKSTAKLKKKYINEVFAFLDENFKGWKNNMYFEKCNKSKKKYKSKIYWKFRIIVNDRLRKRIKKLKNIFKKMTTLFTLQKFVGHAYLKYRKRKIDEKKIIISPQNGNNINGNMFYILKELQYNKEYTNYTTYVVYEKGKKENFTKKCADYGFKNYQLIKINTRKYAKALATAKYLFNDTSFPVYFMKRDEQVYLNTWHGTPLKTLGKATKNDFYDIANLQKNFVMADYLLYPNTYMKDCMIRDYMLENIANNKVMFAGYPRNEIFFDEVRRKEIKEKEQMVDKKVIAYMPTWRGSVRDVSAQEQIERVRNYLNQIDGALQDEEIMYVNFHPYIGKCVDLSNYKNIKSFPSEYETYEFLNSCDILITDYSSVFFDYALTKNKIVLFTYDEEEYLSERGMYISLNDLPFPKVNNVEELIEEIRKEKNYDDIKFLKTYCPYDTGNISKKICARLIQNKKVELKEEKVNESANKNANVFIYVGGLYKNKETDNLISLAKNSKEDKYNYYVSYITSNIKANKRQLRLLEQCGLNYMGQLGSYDTAGRFDKIVLAITSRIKQLYPIFQNHSTRIFQNEIQRNYDGIKFDYIIVYGKIEAIKIYELSCMKGKKVICLTQADDFNTKVHKNVYKKFDIIQVADEETLKAIRKYCNNVKVEKVEKLSELIGG